MSGKNCNAIWRMLQYIISSVRHSYFDKQREKWSKWKIWFSSTEPYTQGYLPPESFRSTSLALFGANWVSKDAENFKELKFFGLVRCFSVKIAQSLKNHPKMAFFIVFGSILDVFEDFLVLTEKQRTKPKNSSSLKFSTSSDTQFDPKVVRLVERNDSGGKYPCVI